VAHYFIPLGYDRILDEGGLGTIARCDALIEEARKIGNEYLCRFVATAGYTKESPTKPTEEVKESLAEQIGQHIRKAGFRRLIIRPCVWGTRDELAVALSEVSQIVTQNWDNTPVIYISTNPGHMPRVRLCCYFLKREFDWNKKIRFIFVPANHSFTRKEWGQETIKLLIYLCRFLFNKW